MAIVLWMVSDYIQSSGFALVFKRNNVCVIYVPPATCPMLQRLPDTEILPFPSL